MITFNAHGQIHFDEPDIHLAFHKGEADFVFLRGEPDEYGDQPCLKRWDDPFSSRPNWFLCMEFMDATQPHEPDIAQRCYQQAQGVFRKDAYEGF